MLTYAARVAAQMAADGTRLIELYRGFGLADAVIRGRRRAGAGRPGTTGRA